MKFYFALFLCTGMLTCVVSPRAWSANSSEPDLQSLLNDANSALQEPATAPKPASQKPIHKSKKKVVPDDDDSDEDVPVAESTPLKPTTPEPPPKIVPINSPDLHDILSVDLAAKERENARSFPETVVRLTGGMNFMGDGYDLIRGDDSFQRLSGGVLGGAYVEYNPTWSITFWGPSVITSGLSLDVGAGYFRGQALMRRSGVQTGDMEYPISSAPVSAEIGPVIVFWKRVGLQFGYGVAGEFIHQEGEGEHDTVTQLVWADTASIALRGYLSDSFEWYLGWRVRGLGLGSDPHIHASMLTSGIGFQFAD